MLDELLKTLAPQAYKSQGINSRNWGSGYVINTSGGPHEIKCSGLIGPNPRFVEDAAFNPPAEILIQHLLGRLQAPPGHDAIAFPMRDEKGVAISNIPDDAWFTLEPDMTFDPNNPVCPKCGQPFVL